MPVKAAHGRELGPLSAEGRSENLHRPHSFSTPHPGARVTVRGKEQTSSDPALGLLTSPRAWGRDSPRKGEVTPSTALATPSLAPPHTEAIAPADPEERCDFRPRLI